MNDLCTYHIQLKGQVEEGEVNALSPLYITALAADPLTTRFAVRTDQAGLMGLLRHLNGLGLTIVSVQRVQV